MENIPKIIKKVIPSVVTIIVSKKLSEVEKELPAELFPLLPFDVPKTLIPEDKIDSRGMVQIEGGSGFIASSDGIILTNKHVVSDAEAQYTVITADNQKYQAEVLARDPVDDVATLKIKPPGGRKNLPPIKLGDSSKLELGQPVLTVGNALGIFKNTVSLGIISGLSRTISASANASQASVQNLRGLIQTDAAINPGNSGGPLINGKGEVIGISAAIVVGAQNLNFAIPINVAKRDLEDIKKFGKVKRPLLGIRSIIIDKNLQEKIKLPVDCGDLIVGKNDPLLQGVIPGTPAEKAGIKEGDIITECNGEKLSSSKTIQDFLEELNPGDILKLKILRQGKKMEIKIKLGVK